MKTIKDFFKMYCCECGEVRVFFWKQRCSFCDKGEGVCK